MLPEETVIVNVQATLSSYKPSPLASGDAIRPPPLEASTVAPHGTVAALKYSGNITLKIMLCACVRERVCVCAFVCTCEWMSVAVIHHCPF